MKNGRVTFDNTIPMVTLELDHKRQQDAHGGTIDSKSRAFTNGKKSSDPKFKVVNHHAEILKLECHLLIYLNHK